MPTRKVFRLILKSAYARPVFYILALVIIAPLTLNLWERNQPHNGFDLNRLSVDEDAIVGGGPGRDEIPALTKGRGAWCSPGSVGPFLAEPDRVGTGGQRLRRS